MSFGENFLTPQERGAQGEPPPILKPTDPSPLAGMFPYPHLVGFQGIFNYVNHIYPFQFDEAMLHSRENAERMRMDPVISGALRLRMMAVALLTGHIEPDDPDDADQIDAAAEIEEQIHTLKYQLDMKRSLLDATFVGRSAYQNRYRWSFKRGQQWMLPALRGRHIDGDKLVFGWDEDTVGILVHGGFSGPTIRTERGPAYVLSPMERQQVVIHKFEPTDASYYRPMQAGSIHGLGLRNILYWLWALKSRIWSLGIDYLEWFAQGLTVFYFESGNPDHLREMKQWVEAQQGRRAILIPRMKDGGPNYKAVERFDASTAGPQFLVNLLTSYFDDLIRVIILGQTLTTMAKGTGLGSGVASAHQDTFEQIVKYDATGLQDTFSDEFISVLYRYNRPGMPPGRWVFDVDSPNSQQVIENAREIWEMGGRVSENALMEAASLPEPGPTDTILSNVQPMQPAAVDGMPEGVPVMDGSPMGPPMDGAQDVAIPGAPLQMSREMQEILAIAKLLSRGVDPSRWRLHSQRNRRKLVRTR